MEILRYILKKLIYGVLVLFGAVTLVFVIFNFKASDPARMLGGQRADPDVIKAIRAELGLDLPLYQQYLLYVNDLSPLSIHNEDVEESHIYLDTAKYDYSRLFGVGDGRTLVLKTPYLRRSYRTKKKVSEIISESMPGTFFLAFTAIFFATILGIFLGIVAAIKKGSFIDNASLVIAVMGMSAPSFYMAMIISLLFGYVWQDTTSLPMIPLLFLTMGLAYGLFMNRKRKNIDFQRSFSWSYLLENIVKFFGVGILIWVTGQVVNGFSEGTVIPGIDWYLNLPGTGLEMTGQLVEINDYGDEQIVLKSLILPTLTLAIRPLAIIVQLTRSSMLEVLSQDYVRTATAKGLSYWSVLFKHALRNALNPVVTAISGWFASLLAGAVFIEYIFDWKGLGTQIYDSLIYDDFPILIGTSLLICSIFVVLNFVVDIIYGLLDPRVRITA